MKHPEENLGRKAKVRIRSRSRQRTLRRAGASSDLSQLSSLGRVYGIQTSYFDVMGRKQEASPETLKALLAISGVSAGSLQEIRAALQESRSRAWRRCLEPVIVSWD